jgi:alpha-D-ribose 1-methylphosphonate 5-phosphate C-P lyase
MKNKQQHEIIRAIHHKDVASFFESIGFLEALQRGEIHCDVCGEQITLENFKATAKKSGKFLFCCDREFCVQKLASKLREVEV